MKEFGIERLASTARRGGSRVSGPSVHADCRPERIRVLHVVSGLGTGGAENFLLGLVCALSDSVESRVISLGEGGGMLPRFRAAQIDVSELRLSGLSGRLQLPLGLARLSRVFRTWRPHVVQGWMNHGNLGAWAVRAVCARRAGLLWSVRQSVENIRNEKRGTQLTLRLQAFLSSRPDRIVCNSQRGLLQHLQLGFDGRRALVIGNGFDCERFGPKPELRDAARQLLGVGGDAMVIAMVARYHPMKDHECFLRAIRSAARVVPSLRAVCIGTGVTPENGPLQQLVEELGLAGSVMLAGERPDLDRLYPGIDVLCLSSAWGEGFPNVVGEAMLSGVPCVATDVGDTETIVGDTGYVVEPRDPDAMAEAIIRAYRLGREGRAQLGLQARGRILEMYSMPAIAERYLQVYRELLLGSSVTPWSEAAKSGAPALMTREDSRRV